MFGVSFQSGRTEGLGRPVLFTCLHGVQIPQLLLTQLTWEKKNENKIRREGKPQNQSCPEVFSVSVDRGRTFVQVVQSSVSVTTNVSGRL